MASPAGWTWVWVNSGSWWWTGRPGMLQFMGSQRVGHDWATELNWLFHCVMEYHLFIQPDSSVQFSRWVMFDSLQPHGLQHARPPCPSPTPRVHSNSCPLSRWCHPTISPSVIPFSSRLQCFPASGSFQMSQFFASGGQSNGVSTSASVLPVNTQDWSPLGWSGWISLQSKGLSKVFSNTTAQKHQFFGAQLYSPTVTSIPNYWKNHRWTFVDKVMSLLLNMLSRLVIIFLPRSKCLLISWLQSPSAVILEPPEKKVWLCFHCFPIYFPWSDGTWCHDLSFLNVEL